MNAKIKAQIKFLRELKLREKILICLVPSKIGYFEDDDSANLVPLMFG